MFIQYGKKGIINMLIKEKVPLVRAKLRTDGSIHIPKGLVDAYRLDPKNVLVMGLFEILKDGDMSELSSFKVSFG